MIKSQFFLFASSSFYLIVVLSLTCIFNDYNLIECHRRNDAAKTKNTHNHHNNKKKELIEDIEHLNEHLKEKINIKNDLSPEEIEFYYFMEHDYNNDSRLDGLEILSAIKHSALSDEIDSNLTSYMTNKERKEQELKMYSDIVDEILKEDDINGDGYLSYLEYVFARRKDE